MSNILPCPFCGGTKLEEVMNDADRSMECLNCHATGPYVDEVMGCPIEMWNSRYPANITITSDDMLASSDGRGTPVSEMKIFEFSDE